MQGSEDGGMGMEREAENRGNAYWGDGTEGRGKGSGTGIIVTEDIVVEEVSNHYGPTDEANAHGAWCGVPGKGGRVVDRRWVN